MVISHLRKPRDYIQRGRCGKLAGPYTSIKLEPAAAEGHGGSSRSWGSRF